MIRKLTILIALLSLTACAPPEAGGELRLGTASLGGAYYPLGQSIANLVNKYGGGVRMVPLVTAGSLQNPRSLMQDEIEVGITNADLAYFAVNGLPPYTDKLALRSLGVLHPSVLQMVTLADSPLNTFEDIRGKRVAVGPANGGTLAFLEVLLREHDMTIDDISSNYLSYTDGFSQLADGNVDASFGLIGVPGAAISQLRASEEIKFLDIDESIMSTILEKYPYYRSFSISRDTYNTAENAVALGVSNLLIVREDLPDSIAYSIVESVYGHMQEFASSNANARQIDPANHSLSPIPTHPGATQYFETLDAQ
ncbi:MAG: TAXI family TRAP transporter solute-binding subunit [Proteobacteria bacterium]|jgi:uncharacterized protein|nr:TAXI family TRAP transporter solute-binding subunit [Pseudomonadota bacterium]